LPACRTAPMVANSMRILAISGSLRARSSNTAALAAAALLAPPGVEIVLYEGLGSLPHFNPDLDGDAPPAEVQALRGLVGQCDGLLLSSPEYAHGIAGAFKNALDWLVAGVEFPGKPVAIINASPRASHADAQLREILVTMSARLTGPTSIALPLLASGLDAEAVAADPQLSALVAQAIQDLVAAVATPASEGS
jgi:chromate reductase, NAD(P)H dehydrogenase (quinone)